MISSITFLLPQSPGQHLSLAAVGQHECRLRRGGRR
jgi:hypothetical protein